MCCEVFRICMNLKCASKNLECVLRNLECVVHNLKYLLSDPCGAQYLSLLGVTVGFTI